MTYDKEVKQAVRGIRSRARACLERNGAAFEGRQYSGPDSVVLPDTLSTAHCELSSGKSSRVDPKCF